MSPATNWVMDVTAEGTLIYNDLDVDTDAGGTFTAKIKTFSTTVTDGRLDLTFTRVSGSAAVCAIEVVQTAAPSVTQNGPTPPALAKTASLPTEFALAQNYPNPFNPSTRISYELPRDTRVTLKVYNLKGEEVRTLVDGHRPAGRYEVEWNAQNNFGARVASGVYLYRLQGEGVNEVRRMVLLQ